MIATRRLTLAALLSLAAAPGLAQQAATVTRFRGTIDATNGRDLTLTTLSGAKVMITVPQDARVQVATAGSMADIKPGSFIGSAARTLPDGTLEALEVHVFSEELRGTGAGHHPWDLGAGSTMTNGTLGSAVGTSGRTLTVDYPGGQKTIAVPSSVPILLMSKGAWSDVKPGAAALVGASQAADGALAAVYLIVGRNGVRPAL